ncbi:unnamed protein product, partial [Strongylus vulgaris]
YIPVSKTPKPPVTRRPRTPTPEPREDYKCLFVADMYNFKNDSKAYDNETAFIAEVGLSFFVSNKIDATAGVWAYGHTNFSDVPELNEMKTTYHAFLENLEKLDYTNISNPLNTTQ